MVETQTKVQTPTGTVDAFEVPIEAISERTTEVELEDGSKIRIRTIIQSIVRLSGKWSDDGLPIYLANGSLTLSIVSVPSKLRRPAILLPNSYTRPL